MSNQMFMYACAYNTAKINDTDYCLSDISALKYFKLNENEKFRNKVKYISFRFLNLLKHNYKFLHLQDNFKDYTNELKNSSHNTWFYGYFQGEQYFKESRNEIRKKFEIKDKYKNEYINWLNYANINKTLVAVHLRIKDYKEFDIKELDGPDLSLPFSYYKKALKEYINNNNYSIVFLSDDIETVEKEFSYISNAVFSKNNAIVDFQILNNAEVLILANSSFSWWGAWLNNNNNKKVIVPEYFLGFKIKRQYPVNIIPENWIQINVYE